MKQWILGLIVAFLFTGCGYKPTAYYAKQALGDKIYAEVSMSRSDPRNTVAIQDAVNEAIVDRFSGKLVSQERADTILKVTIHGMTMTPIVYDTYGYVTEYKTSVQLLFVYTNEKKQTERIITTGEYDFAVNSNGVVADSSRYDAIKVAASKALDEFISKIAIKGIRSGNNH